KGFERKLRSKYSSNSATVMMGMANSSRKLTTRFIHTKTGIRMSVMPGARQFSVVTMELAAGVCEPISVMIRLMRQKSMPWPGEMQADQQRLGPADEEEQEGGDAVEDADPLVVDRRDPAPEAVLAFRTGERAGRSSGHRHGHSGPPSMVTVS